MKPGESGFSMVSGLAGIAILGVVAAGFASFISISSNSQRAIQQKYEALNLYQRVLDSVASSCACMLDPAGNSVNSTPLTFAAGGTVELDAFHASCDNSVPPRPADKMFDRGQPVPGGKVDLRVGAVRFEAISPVGSANPREFQGTFEVTFANGSLQPLRIPMRVTVAAGGPPHRVESCWGGGGGAGGGGGGAGSAGVSFTAPGTFSFTVPANVRSLFVRLVGGGGGGASVPAIRWSSGGGGAGGYSEGILSVTPGQNIPFTIGAGGTPGALANPSTGGAGGATTFGPLSAAGGSGGRGGPANCAGGAPGAGTSPSPHRNFSGSPGGAGSHYPGHVQGGHGGVSYFGGGGRAVQVPDSDFASGTAPGSGGGGAWDINTPGGAGAPGGIIISYSVQ